MKATCSSGTGKEEDEEGTSEQPDEGCDLDIEIIEFLVGSFIRLFPEDKHDGRRRFGHRLREDSRGK